MPIRASAHLCSAHRASGAAGWSSCLACPTRVRRACMRCSYRCRVQALDVARTGALLPRRQDSMAAGAPGWSSRLEQLAPLSQMRCPSAPQWGDKTCCWVLPGGRQKLAATPLRHWVQSPKTPGSGALALALALAQHSAGYDMPHNGSKLVTCGQKKDTRLGYAKPASLLHLRAIRLRFRTLNPPSLAPCLFPLSDRPTPPQVSRFQAVPAPPPCRGWLGPSPRPSGGHGRTRSSSRPTRLRCNCPVLRAGSSSPPAPLHNGPHLQLRTSRLVRCGNTWR